MGTARELFEEGRGECTCFLAPPCGFCVSMDEEEVEAWADDGADGLEALWDERDKRQPLKGTPDAP